MFADGLMHRERYKWKWGFSYSMEDDDMPFVFSSQ